MKPCYWPDHGAVIDSQGFIKPCCMMGGYEMLNNNHNVLDGIHIDHTDSINEYFYSDFLIYLRKSLQENNIEGTPECHNCKLQIENNVGRHFQQSYEYSDYAMDGSIKFLEITTSNICNQTCVTCNSYFSSKWETIEQLFNDKFQKRKQFNLSNDAMDKIIKVLPELKVLNIKGGEPFADIRNAKILEKLVEVNPDCQVWILSNASIISNRFIKVLKRIKNLSLTASLDHIGKKYEWIRSTPFDQTLYTLKRIYEETGIRFSVSPTISYFNILDMEEIKSFYEDFEYTKWHIQNYNDYNFVRWPAEMDCLNTRTQEELDSIDRGLISKFNPHKYNELQNKINIMNEIRGFDWSDEL